MCVCVHVYVCVHVHVYEIEISKNGDVYTSTDMFYKCGWLCAWLWCGHLRVMWDVCLFLSIRTTLVWTLDIWEHQSYEQKRLEASGGCQSFTLKPLLNTLICIPVDRQTYSILQANVPQGVPIVYCYNHYCVVHDSKTNLELKILANRTKLRF